MKNIITIFKAYILTIGSVILFFAWKFIALFVFFYYLMSEWEETEY